MEIFLHVFGAENVFFAAPKAPQKILSTFFEIFVIFVNKNAIKIDFRGDLCRSISKKSHFWQKSISTKDENFECISTEVPFPPLNNSLILTPWIGRSQIEKRGLGVIPC